MKPQLILYCIMAFFTILIIWQIKKEAKRLGMKWWQI